MRVHFVLLINFPTGWFQVERAEGVSSLPPPGVFVALPGLPETVRVDTYTDWDVVGDSITAVLSEVMGEGGFDGAIEHYRSNGWEVGEIFRSGCPTNTEGQAER